MSHLQNEVNRWWAFYTASGIEPSQKMHDVSAKTSEVNAFLAHDT
jgi:hypothetical protein